VSDHDDVEGSNKTIGDSMALIIIFSAIQLSSIKQQ
jgi:hypothetical protein